MKKTIITYSLIAAVIVSGLMLISFPLMQDKSNYDLAEILGFTSIILSASTIFIAVKSYRDKFNNGKVTFGKAFLIGLYISLIAAIVYAVSFQVYVAVSDFDFPKFFKEAQIEKINSQHLDSAARAQKIIKLESDMEVFSHPLIIFLVSIFVEYFPIGLVISLIAAAVYKKK